MNERLEKQLDERTDLLQLVHDVTVFANQSKSIDDALAHAIQRICHFSGWHAGHAYRLAADGSGAIVPTDIWYEAPGNEFSRLKQVTAATRYTKTDVSVVCDVFRQAELQWVDDITTSHKYPRNQSSGLEVHAVIAFPIFVEGNVEAALEFYSRESIVRDDPFVGAMKNVGIQFGHLFERKASDRRIAEMTLAERERLGHELHDSLGQQMSVLGMLVESLKHDVVEESSSNEELFDKLESLIEKSQMQIRSLMVGLMPVDVDGGGLPAALERLSAETKNLYDLECYFEGERDVALVDSFTATQLFLIASEAAHNAAKHAHARKIVIKLTNDQDLGLTVADNGIGLPDDFENSVGMGTRIMRHRANLIDADLELKSQTDGGAIVSCCLKTRGS